MNKKEFIDLIVKNHNSGKWLSCTQKVELGYNAQAVYVGVKAYGKWVQIMEINGVKGSTSEKKTIKAFRVEVEELLNGLLRCNAYEGA